MKAGVAKRKAITPSAIRETVHRYIRYSRGMTWEQSTHSDKFHAVALAVRERLIDGMQETESRYTEHDAKRLYYLSLEFLIGRSLRNNLSNLGLYEQMRDELASLDVDLASLLEEEDDAALGNGGLGRLAACFLDSLATLGMPGYGYGINYEFGLFRQQIDHQGQKEQPDQWLWEKSPWLIERPHEACVVPLYGHVVHETGLDGEYNPMWMGWSALVGVPYDMPIVGYGGKTVNYLRLFSARASDEFELSFFNEGDYVKALEQKISSETVSKILYPSDKADAGKELRLIQEYFLVACAVGDIVKRYLRQHKTFDDFSKKVAIQLNDTHPALTVVELMRVLLDEHHLPWETAWAITTATLGYTNHTLMPEALEKWPVPLFEKVLPRHLQLIYEINHRFLQTVRQQWPNDIERVQRMSIIDEQGSKQVRMANLAIVGSHSVNGVAALHSKLVTTQLVPDFFQLWPKKFSNKTNGVSQRRWLEQANPDLAVLISETIGREWVTDLTRLKALELHSQETGFCNRFMRVKRLNKERLAKIVWQATRTKINPDSMFIIQAKRIHEYKRQLLNVMQIIDQYLGIVEDGVCPAVPRTYIFSGKAAPGYWAAKQIIRLICDVARVVNQDARANAYMSVVFIPDYRVSLAETLIPAADLSVQISTAGMEASGTGNMKFAMNGALTIGTLDGANIEIMEEVGRENIFIFGLTADEIKIARANRSYDSWHYYRTSRHVQRVMDVLKSDRFCAKEPGLYGWIYENLMNQGDWYCHLADLDSYIGAQQDALELFERPTEWARKAVLNVARMGKFSSDRTIHEYAKEIWNIEPVF